MKKKIVGSILILLFTVVIITGLVACKDDESEIETQPQLTYSIAVISDLQVVANSQVTRSDTDGYYLEASAEQTMLDISEPILATTVDKLLESKPDVVLITGDLTNNGTVESMNAVSEQLNRLENEGIEVFVTGGVDDFFGNGEVYKGDFATTEATLPIDDFPIKMARFGYRQALSKDKDSLSYVADLPGDKYRLLVLDTISNYSMQESQKIWNKDRTEISDDTMQYIEKSLQDAVEDGREMIVMSYLPINEANDNFLYMLGNYYLGIERYKEVDALLTKYGVTKVFSGSTHYFHNVEYSDDNGTTTDYYVGSLCMYPVSVFYFNEYDDGQISTVNKSVDKLNADYIPSPIHDETKYIAISDLTKYSELYLQCSTRYKLIVFLDRYNVRNYYFGNLLKKCGLYDIPGVSNDTVNVMLYYLREALIYWIDMPIYGETDSIQSILLSHGRTIPYIEDKSTVFYAFAELLAKVYTDELDSYKASENVELLKDIIIAGFDILTDIDFFGALHQVNDDVLECNLEPFADNLYSSGIIDLKQNDLILSMFSIIKLYLINTTKLNLSWINFSTSENALNALSRLKGYLPKMFNADYDKDNNTLWGMEIDKYINIKSGIIYAEKALEDNGIEVIARALLYVY